MEDTHESVIRSQHSQSASIYENKIKPPSTEITTYKEINSLLLNRSEPPTHTPADLQEAISKVHMLYLRLHVLSLRRSCCCICVSVCTCGCTCCLFVVAAAVFVSLCC